MKKSGRKSDKFVTLTHAALAQEKYLLPGRRECNCEASKHALINNCLECGRIVCEQEGSGPCFFCGALVCTPKEQEVIMRQSKTSFKLYNKLMNSDESNVVTKSDSKLDHALEQRDKLLEYDRNVEKRTKVIDDENDFFQVDNKWLSEKQRQAIKKKKEELFSQMHDRRQQKITLDFAGRKVVEEKPDIHFDEDELLKSDISIFEYKDHSKSDLPPDLQLIYQEEKKGYGYRLAGSPDENKSRLYSRIQDRDLQEMSDEGKCLSLHQPFASLLVAGIKIHEGRSWYTSHRGRLWIHAAGKIASKEDIDRLENTYKHIRGDCKFPKTYPSACLLGCVHLVDCLPQEEYKIQYPKGEIASPYVFICENAQELNVKFPMQGKHKIFTLESNIHQAAKKILIKKL